MSKFEIKEVAIKIKPRWVLDTNGGNHLYVGDYLISSHEVGFNRNDLRKYIVRSHISNTVLYRDLTEDEAKLVCI
jgi:hypothetical protein